MPIKTEIWVIIGIIIFIVLLAKKPMEGCIEADTNCDKIVTDEEFVIFINDWNQGKYNGNAITQSIVSRYGGTENA